jgi:tRNA A-37 threonylcarbamoyl transferase component Bud32
MDLVAKLHEHPWLHRDLHAGNILVDPSGLLLVTDLHSVWRVPRLTRRQRIGNVARLIFSMRGAIDLARAPALIRRYALSRHEDAEDLVRDVRGQLTRFEADYRRGRIARCLQTSSLFVAERVPEGRLFRRRGYPLTLMREDLRSHVEFLAGIGARVLGQATRGHVTLVGASPGERVVKEYGPPAAISALRQLLGYGRARTAWVGARRLGVLDIATPEALALLERRDGTAVLVTRALADARQLRVLAPELAREAPSPRRAAVALALGHLVGRLARAGLRHADLSAKNVFVQPGPALPARDIRDRAPEGAADLQLIDLDGLKPMPPFDHRGLVRMLEQLADLPVRPSRADLRRFASAYAATAGRELPRAVAAQALAGATARAAARAQAGRPAGAARPAV